MPPILPPSQPLPSSLLRYGLHIQDLEHRGTDIFLNAFGPNPRLLLQRCAAFVAHTLYDQIPSDFQPKVETITLILRHMPGLAHTSGSEKHKEIHFSLDYIQSLSPAIASAEMEGVIVHEVVHCFQYDAHGTCPGGLIEDFVRLRANLVPPHWSKVANGNWDAGYEKTGYFLDWIENRQSNTVGLSFVKDLNLAMKDCKFDPSVFQDLTGSSLNELWRVYSKGVERNK